MKPTVDTLIISAGYSLRMKDFKPLMTYHNLPFIISIIAKTSAVSSNILVVTGYRAEDLETEIERWLNRIPQKKWLELVGISAQRWNKLKDMVKLVYNPLYEQGMMTSLQTGIRKLKKPQWTLYHFVDQPHIPPAFYSKFFNQIIPTVDWVQPRLGAKNGHPILFNQRVSQLILQLSTAGSLFDIYRDKSVNKKFWDCNYPQIRTDFDTPEDLNGHGGIDEPV